jgi:hypothetical protein
MARNDVQTVEVDVLDLDARTDPVVQHRQLDPELAETLLGSSYPPSTRPSRRRAITPLSRSGHWRSRSG